jgi:hypothetical protein
MWEETNEYTDYQPKWGPDKAALGGIAALGAVSFGIVALNRGGTTGVA